MARAAAAAAAALPQVHTSSVVPESYVQRVDTPPLPPTPERLAGSAVGAVLPAAQQWLLSLLRPLVHPSSTASSHYSLRSLPADSLGGSRLYANLEQRGRFPDHFKELTWG